MKISWMALTTFRKLTPSNYNENHIRTELERLSGVIVLLSGRFSSWIPLKKIAVGSYVGFGTIDPPGGEFDRRKKQFPGRFSRFFIVF
jgi:hypothetical protein